jgi:hypothetical protein
VDQENLLNHRTVRINHWERLYQQNLWNYLNHKGTFVTGRTSLGSETIGSCETSKILWNRRNLWNQLNGLPVVCVESADTCGTSRSDGSLAPTEPIESALSWTNLKQPCICTLCLQSVVSECRTVCIGDGINVQRMIFYRHFFLFKTKVECRYFDLLFTACLNYIILQP